MNHHHNHSHLLNLPLSLALKQLLLLPHIFPQLLPLHYPPLLHLTLLLKHTQLPHSNNINHAGHCCLPLTLLICPSPHLRNHMNMTIPLPTTHWTVMRRDYLPPLYILTVTKQLAFPGLSPNVTSAPNCVTYQPTLTIHLYPHHPSPPRDTTPELPFPITFFHLFSP